MRRHFPVIAVALSLVTVFAAPAVTAQSSTLVVDDDGSDCPAAGYASIQAAIDAASAGDVVEVCPGTYAEHVNVDVADLDLLGANAGVHGVSDVDRGDEATIEGQVVVGASGVVLDGFEVSPPDPTTNAKGEALRVGNSPDDVVIRNNVVRDFDGSDLPDWEGADAIVAFGGDENDPIENVVITRNKVKHIQGNAVKGGATGVSIQGNVQGATVQDNHVSEVGMEATGWAFGLVVRGTGNHGEVPSNVQLTDNSVTRLFSNPSTSTVGVGIGSEADASEMTVSDNAVTVSELLVENKDTDHVLDVTGNWWGDANGPNTTENPLETSAAGIGGAGDVAYLPWLDGPSDVGGEFTGPVENVDAGSFHLGIQDAVDAADAGETLEARAGPFDEDVAVDKPLTLRGAQAGVPAQDRDADETRVSSVRLEADDVTVDGFQLQAPPCADGAGVGVWTSPSHSGYTVANNVIEGYNRGAEVRTDGEDVSVVESNHFLDNDCGTAAGLLSGFAPPNPMQNVEIVDNAFEGHTEGPNSYAIQLVNGGDHNDVTISGNSMEASVVLCDVDDLTISDNEVVMDDPDSSTALFVCGGVDGASITDNVLDGSERGLWIAPGFFSGETNTGFEVLGNTITGNPTAGIQVAEDRYEGDLPVRFNEIAGNGVGVDNQDPDLRVDATHNWWGSPLGPTVTEETAGLTGDPVQGPVDYAPWCLQPSCPANGPVHDAPAPHVAAGSTLT